MTGTVYEFFVDQVVRRTEGPIGLSKPYAVADMLADGVFLSETEIGACTQPMENQEEFST